MKKGIIAIAALLLVVCTSCTKLFDNNATLFFVVNNCNQPIEVVFKWSEYTMSGIDFNTVNTNVSSGASYLVRSYVVEEEFSMSSVFTSVEIREESGVLSSVDALDRDNWVRTQNSYGQDEYTLFVDSTFF